MSKEAVQKPTDLGITTDIPYWRSVPKPPASPRKTTRKTSKDAVHDTTDPNHITFQIPYPSIAPDEPPVNTSVASSSSSSSSHTASASQPSSSLVPIIETILSIPGTPYTIDEIHFILWYSLTTTLNPDKIAILFNAFFKPPAASTTAIDRWAIADIVHCLENRWEANGQSFGQTFRLQRPVSVGSCPCDFTAHGLFDGECVNVKRTRHSRTNERYLSIAQSLWDEGARELVLCSRGGRKRKGSGVISTAHAAENDNSPHSRSATPQQQILEPHDLPPYDIRRLFSFILALLAHISPYIPTILRCCIHVGIAYVLFLVWEDPHSALNQRPSQEPREHALLEQKGAVFATLQLMPQLLMDLVRKGTQRLGRSKPWSTLLLDALCGWVGLFCWVSVLLVGHEARLGPR